MTDETLKLARRMAAEKQPGNRRIIEAGGWDGGDLVRNAVAEVLRNRQEAEPE